MEIYQEQPVIDLKIDKSIKRNKLGKIRIKGNNPSSKYIKITLVSLLVLTLYGFLTFDYKGIDMVHAISQTLVNMRTMFFEAELTHFTFEDALNQVGITMALGFLTTLTGAIIALFLGIFAARNLSNARVSNVIKAFVAFIRAIPTVLWVLIFAITVGLGSEAAVIGMTFHTVGYLIKAYSETFEELDEGVIEALKASGASFWQIFFQAILPSSATSLVAWTFMRFEINFTNAVAMGAAAGAGGIGFELFMASNFYFNVQEVGFIAITILVCALILEMISTNLKKRFIK